MAGIPNITGSFGWITDANCSGAYSRAQFAGNWMYGMGDFSQYSVDFNASLSSSIYGSSTTVTPLSMSCLICISY